jgi:hypothetical protein
MDKNVRNLVFIPVVAVIGIYVVEVLIEELFEVTSAVKYLFWGVGGIGFFAAYFRKKNRQALEVKG